MSVAMLGCLHACLHACRCACVIYFACAGMRMICIYKSVQCCMRTCLCTCTCAASTRPETFDKPE